MKGVNWEEELYGKYVNGIWEVICDKITDAVERNVPKMKTNMSKKSKPIWMTYKAQKAVKAKYNSWKNILGASSITILRISKESEIKLQEKSGEQG